ncbi:putative C6 zinc finger protein [Seiridium cardinale]
MVSSVNLTAIGQPARDLFGIDPLELTQAMPPMMNYTGNSPDFGYAAFLQDQEVDYLTEERSSNSNSAFNCQETRPSCGHCAKTGLQCEYPAVPQVTHQPQHQIPLFSLQDMRFFQHFLQVCFPRHPLGNESIWTHEIPCLSHKYEYLMHAILGPSASELMVKEPSLLTFAMAHRLKAIKAIKKTLAEIPKSNTFEQGNALMATCFALTFQSVMLDDGMAEYMTFIRGIIITAIQMWCKGAKFLFHDFGVKKEWTDMAVAGIRALQPLRKHPVEVEYYVFILDIAETLYTSPFTVWLIICENRKAYQILCKHYGWWMQISHENFAHLIDPENATCALLASHWIALKQIMATITEKEYEARAQTPAQEEKGMDLGMIRWLRHINRQVPPEYQQSNQWPVWVEAQLDVDLISF